MTDQDRAKFEAWLVIIDGISMWHKDDLLEAWQSARKGMVPAADVRELCDEICGERREQPPVCIYSLAAALREKLQ